MSHEQDFDPLADPKPDRYPGHGPRCSLRLGGSECDCGKALAEAHLRDAEREERAAYWRRTVEVGRVEDDRCYVGPGAEEQAAGPVTAEAESAPAVVTGQEIYSMLIEYADLLHPFAWGPEVSRAIAALVAERTAAAVAAARAEERQAERACWESALADERSGRGSWGGEKDRWRMDAAKHIEQVAAAIRARGQSEVPAPAPAARPGGESLCEHGRDDPFCPPCHVKAREARVQALVEAAEAAADRLEHYLHPQDCVSRALRGAIERLRAFDAPGKGGA